MKLNFYQVAIVVLLAGLFGYFVWPTLYTYQDVTVRRSIRTLNGTPEFSYEQVRIREHRINGLAEKDLGLGRWGLYVRSPKCGRLSLEDMLKGRDGGMPCEQ